MERRTLLQAAGAATLLAAAPRAHAQTPRKILLVTTSHAEALNGRKTGVWLSTVTDPYWLFRDAGYAVEIGSLQGAAPPIDPRSGSERALPARFRHDDAALHAFNEATCLDCVDGRRYAAVFLAGGHGALWDFPTSAPLRGVVEHAARERKPIGAVGHGTAAWLGARIDGRPLVAGRRLACFTDQEEERAHWVSHVPYSLEQRLKGEGAGVVAGAALASHAVRDGPLLSGQNPASAAAAARLVLEALKAG